MAGFLVVAALLEEESPLKFLDELNFEYEQQLYSGDLNGCCQFPATDNVGKV